jgi:hypothetical protein
MAVHEWIVKPIHSKEDIMESVLLDVAGHRRSPATMLGYYEAMGAGSGVGPGGFVSASCSLAAAASWSGCGGCDFGRGFGPRAISASKVRNRPPRGRRTLREHAPPIMVGFCQESLSVPLRQDAAVDEVDRLVGQVQ